jgi:hypothetical protein
MKGGSDLSCHNHEGRKAPPASRIPQNTSGLYYNEIEDIHVGS